jgi:DNA-binding transcriptional LysR family regulator
MAASDPDWNDFKILLALGQGGSVAGAARVLGVDGSTVSRRLAALETAMGACLIVRGGQKFAWTAEGRAVLSAAEAMDAAVVEATRAVRTTKIDPATPVIVSCPPGLSAMLTRMMRDAQEKHPGVEIELSGENRTVDLSRGEADIAVRMFRPDEPSLVCKHAFELGWGVYAAKSYLESAPPLRCVEDLPAHRLVRYVSSMHRVPGPRWLEEHRGNAAGSVQVDNTEVATNVVAAGGGVGVLLCARAEDQPDLVRVLPGPVATHTGWLVFHESARDSVRIRTAIEVLAGLFEANSAALSGIRD